MTVPPELQRFRMLLRDMNALGCAIYRILPPGSAQDLELWGTHSAYANGLEDHREIAESLRARADYCFRLNTERIMTPRVPDQLYPDGSGKWGFVIGCGPVRDAGYVIAAVIRSSTEVEVRAYMAATHELMNKGQDQESIGEENRDGS